MALSRKRSKLWKGQSVIFTEIGIDEIFVERETLWGVIKKLTNKMKHK
jgi:hypothetical protein